MRLTEGRDILLLLREQAAPLLSDTQAPKLCIIVIKVRVDVREWSLVVRIKKNQSAMICRGRQLDGESDEKV